MKKNLLVCSYFILQIFAAHAQVNPFDSLNLVDLYNTLDGPNWKQPWNLTKPVSQWHGIVLDLTEEYVYIIDLDGKFDSLATGAEANLNTLGENLSGDITGVFSRPFERLVTGSFGGNKNIFGEWSIIAPDLLFLNLNYTGVQGFNTDAQMGGLRRLHCAYADLEGSLPEFELFAPKVELLQFEGNRLEGSLDGLNALINLTNLNIGVNRFGAKFPVITASRLDGLFLRKNAFTFDDLSETFDTLYKKGRPFEYKDQDSVGQAIILNAALDFPFDHDFLVDSGVPDIQFFWYKAGQIDPIEITTTPIFKIDTVMPQDSGIYWCRIVNTRMTELSLFLRPFFIKTCNPDIFSIDTLLCVGQSVSVRGVVYDGDKRNGVQRIKGATLNGCDSVYVVNLKYREILTPNTFLCGATPVSLVVNNPDQSSGYWSVNSGAFIENPAASETTISDLVPGVNKVSWTFDPSVCSGINIHSLDITYDPAPALRRDVYHIFIRETLKDSVLTRNDEWVDHTKDAFSILTQPSNGALDPASDSTFVYTPDPDFYGVDSFSYEIYPPDCPGDFRDTATVLIFVQLKDTPIIISPNRDGENEILVIKSLADEPRWMNANDLIIVNAWGGMVYNTKNYQNDWNGINLQGAELPEATYYFTLTVKDQKPVHGRIAVIR